MGGNGAKRPYIRPQGDKKKLTQPIGGFSPSPLSIAAARVNEDASRRIIWGRGGKLCTMRTFQKKNPGKIAKISVKKKRLYSWDITY